MPTVGAIVAEMDAWFPPDLVADWDNVGLLLGDPAATVNRLLTCLTLTAEVVAEAVERGHQLIVTHHPILFRGAKRLTTTTTEGRTVLALARHGIAVYSPHTALDNAPGGINVRLAERLGLTEIAPLRRGDGPRQCKIVVFVPDADLVKVSDALFATGAGRIGEYRECSFRLGGTGTFFGGESTDPAVGRKGRREEVTEWRLEVVCRESDVDRVVRAMKSAHSYEEPAYDIYPLRSLAGNDGAGRVGRFSSPVMLADLAKRVRDDLKCGPVQIVGDVEQSISRLAIACGAAGDFLTDALRAKADAFLTGEMRFHDYLAARALGMALILPGHYATERFAVEELAQRLAARWPEIESAASRREVDPVAWV
jgi:dinuclear metal center YbgI/SA1388 family protein